VVIAAYHYKLSTPTQHTFGANRPRCVSHTVAQALLIFS